MGAMGATRPAHLPFRARLLHSRCHYAIGSVMRWLASRVGVDSHAPDSGAFIPCRHGRQRDAMNSLSPACFYSCAQCAGGWASDEPSSRFAIRGVSDWPRPNGVEHGAWRQLQIAFIVVLSKWQWRRNTPPGGAELDLGHPMSRCPHFAMTRLCLVATLAPVAT